jgi:SAM-dependent methyltransferase
MGASIRHGFRAARKRFPGRLPDAGETLPPRTRPRCLETAILRREAAAKFPQAAKMYFTREALEQASSWPVAEYRASRYRDFDHVLDLGCSIGGDTLPLSQVTHTTGLDIDSLRLAMAQANARALGLDADFLQADLNDYPLPSASAAFFDPARRQDHRRAFSVEDYTPPLSVIERWLPDIPALGVKISPGVDLDEIGGYDCEVEFISVNRELKEAVLWFGPLKTAHRRATLLPGPYTLIADDIPPLPLNPPKAYLYEPDPAVLRAGLVTVVGAQLEAAQLDRQIAYLTGDTLVDTPFARAWAVEDWMPFQLKRLRAYLRERNVGHLTVKKRGSPLVPEELICDLRLEGEEEKTLFLTQMEGKPITIIGDEIKFPAED